MENRLKSLACCNCKKAILNTWWIRINKHIYCQPCRDEYQTFLSKKNLVLTRRWQNSKSSYYKTFNRWLLDKSLPQLRKLIKQYERKHRKNN